MDEDELGWKRLLEENVYCMNDKKCISAVCGTDTNHLAVKG